MKEIDLRTFYPEIYEVDYTIAVSKEIARALAEEKRIENAQKRRIYWNRAHFSLDTGDGIEGEAALHTPSLYEAFDLKITQEQLFSALLSLSKKQCRRLYSHYFLGISKSKLAQTEQVNESSIRESIERGLEQLRKKMNKIF